MEKEIKINKASYLAYLRKANNGELHPTNRLAGIELKIVRELIAADLLSDSKERYLSTSDTNKTFITPKGSITLHEWEKEIKENSVIYKIGGGFIRFLWIIVGRLVALITRWLNKYLG